jgi:hypothetical protein
MHSYGTVGSNHDTGLMSCGLGYGHSELPST